MSPLLIGKIKNAGGSTTGSGNCSCLKIIAGNCGGQWQFHVRVYINCARKDILSLSIKYRIAIYYTEGTGRTNSDDLLTFNQNIALKFIGCCNDTTVRNN